jgi:hypothetical protein
VIAIVNTAKIGARISVSARGFEPAVRRAAREYTSRSLLSPLPGIKRRTFPRLIEYGI